MTNLLANVMNSEPQPSLPHLSAVILAGGEGRRMGGVDKGLVVYHHRPLIEWVLHALPPEVSQIVISCNRNLDVYAAYGDTVSDAPSQDRYAGALAGIRAGLANCRAEWVIVSPCDLIFYPTRFAAVAWAGLSTHLAQHPTAARIAVAHDGERRQNLCLLLHRDEAAELAAALQRSPAVHAWLDARGALSIPWDDLRAFTNVNDLATLQQLDAED
jgi:molybdopterin-guanine dinucleotide biosynthesis protein A